MPTPDQETQRLLEFSLAEEELHAAIDRVDAFPRQAKALLKTLGTAYLSERKTKWWSVRGAEANTLLRHAHAPDDMWIYLSMFTSRERSLCWSLGAQPLFWRGGIFDEIPYSLSNEPLDVPVIKFAQSSDLLQSDEDRAMLFEVWHPKAGGILPQRADGPLASYLDLYVSDIHDTPPPFTRRAAARAAHPPPEAAMRTKPDPAYEPPNVVTLLTAKRWRLTKRITKAGEKQPAETPTLFTHAAEPVADLEDLFGLLRWLISMLASRHGRVLLVCQQKVLAALKSAGLPDNVTTGHFNALEGLDNYAQFDAIIILGRPLAKLSGVIPLAEAAAGRCLAASFGKQADPNTLFVPRRKNVHTAKDCGSSVRSRRPIRPGGPDHDDAPGEGA